MVASREVISVSFDLISESVESEAMSGIDHLLYINCNLFSVGADVEHEVSGPGALLVGSDRVLVKFANLVDLGELTDGSEEFVGGNG